MSVTEADPFSAFPRTWIVTRSDEVFSWNEGIKVYDLCHVITAIEIVWRAIAHASLGHQQTPKADFEAASGAARDSNAALSSRIL